MAAGMNTKTSSIISSDIYELADFYEGLRESTIPEVSQTSSMVGIFGYINEIFMQTMQNTLIVASETSNETIPTKAKFSKNVIAHALNYGINDINAKPAVMTVMVMLPIPYIENNFTELDPVTGKAKFILDNKIPFTIENYEFHLDYDIIINRIKNPSGQYIYTAMYDLFESGTNKIKQKNPISDINNPYITTVIQTTINNVKFIGFSVRMHQVSYTAIVKNVVTDNIIENKTITFEFSNQLAAFDVDVTEKGKTTHLMPVYNGLLDYTIEDGTWCLYEYVAEDMIRILFSRDSYVPGQNAEVVINVYQSQGASGNFTYNNQLRVALTSERFNNYGGMYAFLIPMMDGVSAGGKDKKSIVDLKKIIPREATSRGAIVNTTDLYNFFNSINDSDCNLFIKKKRDNPFERLYYMYMLLKRDGDVYPTNTLNLKIEQDDFQGFAGNNNMSINPGTVFYYYDHGSFAPDEEKFASINKPQIYEHPDSSVTYPCTINANGDYVRVFEYTSPFLITIDSDLISSYLLTVMDEMKILMFDSINTDSDLQFIATNMRWTRNFFQDDGTTYDNKYTMLVTMTQNNPEDYNLIQTSTDEDGNIRFDDIRIKMYIVLYSDSTAKTPYKYKEAELIEYDESKHVMTFRFIFETNDLMDLKNRINITGIYNTKPEPYQLKTDLENSHGYMGANTYAKLFILADFGTRPGDTVLNADKEEVTVTEETQQIILHGSDGIGNRTELESIIPTKADLIDRFLRNELYIDLNGERVNVVYIMRSNPLYMKEVMEYNNDESQTNISILKYLRNNRSSDFVQNVLLQDQGVLDLFDSYNYEDLSRYTVCNTMIVEDGLDFYHDYSDVMRSVIEVAPVKTLDQDGNVIHREVQRYDAYGNRYVEYVPVYRVNTNGNYYYQYTVNRVPLIKNGYLNTEKLIQNFVYALEERRKYIEVCLKNLEDTFDIDFKFINTYGPSRTFYYEIPTENAYEVYVNTKLLNVYDDNLIENDPTSIRGILKYMQIVRIDSENGQWGHISSPIEGWIKLADTKRLTTYVDNVAISLKFAIRLQSSADKNIINSIIRDIKDFIEDINEITELHVSNIITLITNNYREQIIFFQFMGINNYGVPCQHLYVDDPDATTVDIVPEFINVASSEDGLYQPLIEINIV